MINKIRFFGGELKHSLVFVIVVTLQIAVSIFLLNWTLTEAYDSTVETKYYSKKVADDSYVLFNGGSYFGSTEVGDLKKMTDLKDLATTFEIGNIEKRWIDKYGDEQVAYDAPIGVATPALMKNFHTFNTKLDYGNSKGYYEAQLSGYATEYKVGEIYDINYQTSDEQAIKTVKVKIVGQSTDRDYYYRFDYGQELGHFIYPSMPFKIMICDELFAYDYAELDSGIFVNDTPTSHYTSLGFSAKTVQQLYDNFKAFNLENSKFTAYMAIVLIIFSFVSTFCLYLINVYKADRKRAVNYICGVTPRSQLTIELIKMVTIFVLAFIPNLAVSIILGAEALYNTMGGNMVTVPYAIAATAIMLGVYGLSIAVGMVKYVKTKPVQIINNVH